MGMVAVLLVVAAGMFLYVETKRGNISFQTVSSETIINQEGKIVSDSGLWFYSNGKIGTQGFRVAHSSETNAMGVLAADGSWAVEPQYASVSFPFSFSGDDTSFVWAQTTRDGYQWGLIEIGNGWVIEPKLEEQGSFDQKTRIALGKDAKTRQWGLIDFEGNWVVEPEFVGLGYLDQESGLIPAKKSEYSRWGLIDLSGNWVVEPKFWSVSNIMYDLNGQASVDAVLEDNGAHGRIDLKGNWLIEPHFGSSYEFTEGGIAFTTAFNGDGRYGIIDTEGNWICEPLHQEKGNYRSVSLVPLDDPETGLIGCVDVYGNWAIAPAYDSIDFYYADNAGELMIIVKKDGRIGVIDETGQWIVEAKYLSILPIEDKDVFFAKDIESERYGIIDKHSEWVVDPVFPNVEVSPFWAEDTAGDPERLAVQAESGYWGYIDLQGNWLIEPRFLEAAPYDEAGTAVVTCEFEIVKIYDWTSVSVRKPEV